jgi:hypothetical protein
MSDELRVEMLAERKAARQLRDDLAKLINTCHAVVDKLDAEMRQPSDFNRGRRIAALTNALEMAADAAERFGLGIVRKGPRRPA